MKSTKTFNNISDKLKALIPKLKRNEVVTFQMLNGQPNPDPDEKERTKDPVLYGKKQITTNLRIYDEFQKDAEGKEVGAYVDIGCVDIWKGENPEVFRFFVPGQGEFSRFGGKFSLMGGRQKDEELFEILWLSPEREGSPCKDSNTQPIMKILDLKADTKTSISKFDTLKKSLDLAKEIKIEKAREVMAALNQPTYQDETVLMGKIKELASSKPDLFISTYESDETPTKAMVRAALDAGVIDHDLPTGQVKIGGLVIATLRVDTIESFVPAFAKWLSTAENGKDVSNNIKSAMGKKKDKVS